MKRINDLVARVARLTGAGGPDPRKGGNPSLEAPDGITAYRDHLGALLGVSRDSLWRWSAPAMLDRRRAHEEPAWLLFALLGVAMSRGDRARASKLLERELGREL